MAIKYLVSVSYMPGIPYVTIKETSGIKEKPKRQ
jgi:hypothetical protein